MAENKKSFVLYADLLSVVEKIVIRDREQKTNYGGELFLHILKYVNDQQPVPIDFIIEMAFEPIRLQLKRDLQKYEVIKEKRSTAGKKSAEIKKQNATKSTHVESVETCLTNPTVNVNGNVNDNVNVTDILLEKVTKYDDDAHAENFRQKENAKTFLIEKKQIQMDRLKMKYKFTQDQLHLKIDEFIEKKFDWGDNTWRDENEMSKNFELWLDKNRTVIINPYKSWNEEEFKAECQKHKKEFGAKVLTDFFRYWNQQTETGVMRFQAKNAWNTEQQLKIWKSKNGK